jgi:glycosyltransferase involved in cell wall biosynthesis
MRVLHRSLHVPQWRSPEVEVLRSQNHLGADIVLSLSGYIFPDMYPLMNVLVVHDLQHEYHPEFFSPHVLEERKRVFGDSIRRADHLIAVSEYTRQTVIERFNIDPCKITRVYEAADPIFHPEHRRSLNRETILQKYNLSEGEYLLFPSNTWPHKNHQGALEALAILRDAYHLSPLLVCTGTPKEAHSAVMETIQRLSLDRQVRFLGYCPIEDMPVLYEGAAALVFPSFFEGFGIPLLEAMWCDCAIVCSNVTSLSEIAGGAAILIDPRSPEELAQALSRVLTDGTLRQTLIERGRQRVQKFSWRNFTIETVRILAKMREMR